MDATVSISKGVFVFKNGFAPSKETRARKEKQPHKKAPNTSAYAHEVWHQSYSSLWNTIEKKIEKLNQDMYSKVLANLLDFIKESYVKEASEIPSAALMTGINMPDHSAQFATLSQKIKQDISPHVALLYAQDCQSIKYLVENLISQFVNVKSEGGPSADEDSYGETKRDKISKSQYNFAALLSWYENEYRAPFNRSPTRAQRSLHKHKVLVVVFPDFESFNARVLQHFILIASSYVNVLPFVLVFGIATSLMVLHRMLPYQVSSKVNVQVFNSQPSITYLNDVLEHVFLTDDCPFHLGGKVFSLFTDVFLFYDFSVTGFIQKFKYAMFEHFSYGNAKALCARCTKTNDIISKLTERDCEDIRRLLSFRRLVESEPPKNRIKLLTDDMYFKSVLRDEIEKTFKYLNTFHLYLKCLHVLVHDLPNTPLGKHLRELYAEAACRDLTKTSGYRECFQLLGFQSKEELSKKVVKMCELLEEEADSTRINRAELEEDASNLSSLVEEMTRATLNVNESDDLARHVESLDLGGKLDRKQLKEKLLENTKRSKPMNKYEIARRKLLDFISSLLEKYLRDPKSNNFHEIFFFDDVSVENHVVGTHRAGLHVALNDPHFYLQCPCCKLPNDAAILRTMPDICIAYKLHLEYGKMINLYDWLQAYLSIVDPLGADDDDETEAKEIDPKLQARFTLAVAELEFLGFVKSSKRKTDHVQRLTWGGG